MPTDITLGPWTADKSIEEAQSSKLKLAMDDEAWKAVKRLPAFRAQKPPEGKDAAPGCSITGRINRVNKTATGTEVAAHFNVLLDGFFTTAVTLVGRATASGRFGVEEALRAVTESRLKTLLDAIKSGRVQRQG